MKILNSYEYFKTGPQKGEPKTIEDRLVRFLIEENGVTEVHSKKWRVFISKHIDCTYFIKEEGTVKRGKNVSSASFITKSFHKEMLLWERACKESAIVRNRRKE